MAASNLVVVGASAGGVEALISFFSQLSANLQAAVLVVLHVPTTGTSILPSIINRKSSMPASHVVDGEEIKTGHIYIAPPNYHLIVEDEKLLLSHGPRVNGVRPSIDILFHSAAKSNGPNVIGVILSGTMMDGVMGLQDVKTAGGITIVQNPDEASFPGMPMNAIERVDVDYVLTIENMAEMIVRLVEERSAQREKKTMSMNIGKVSEKLQLDRKHFEMDDQTSPRTLLTCPECGGVLWELSEQGILRYQCQVGHIFSGESMIAEQDGAVEYALWAAVRVLEERAALSRRMASRSKERGSKRSAEIFNRTAGEAESKADTIRDLLLKGGANLPDLPESIDVVDQAQRIKGRIG